jgi:hypothetical protein
VEIPRLRRISNASKGDDSMKDQIVTILRQRLEVTPSEISDDDLIEKTKHTFFYALIVFAIATDRFRAAIKEVAREEALKIMDAIRKWRRSLK